MDMIPGKHIGMTSNNCCKKSKGQERAGFDFGWNRFTDLGTEQQEYSHLSCHSEISDQSTSS